jgi:hypothetical protein
MLALVAGELLLIRGEGLFGSVLAIFGATSTVDELELIARFICSRFCQFPLQVAKRHSHLNRFSNAYLAISYHVE